MLPLRAQFKAYMGGGMWCARRLRLPSFQAHLLESVGKHIIGIHYGGYGWGLIADSLVAEHEKFIVNAIGLDECILYKYPVDTTYK